VCVIAIKGDLPRAIAIGDPPGFPILAQGKQKQHIPLWNTTHKHTHTYSFAYWIVDIPRIAPDINSAACTFFYKAPA